jgi:hypothetical protein
MAWTVTRDKTILGNKAVVNLKLTADAATQNVQTGLKRIDHFSQGFGSMSTLVGLTVAINSNATGVATDGTLGLSGFTSGDDLYVTVYGVR